MPPTASRSSATPSFNGPSKRVQIVGSPPTRSPAHRAVRCRWSSRRMAATPSRTTRTRRTDYLNIQDTYTVPSPRSGPCLPERRRTPLLPSTSPTGAFPVRCRETLTRAPQPGEGHPLPHRPYRPVQRGVLVGSSALTATNVVRIRVRVAARLFAAYGRSVVLV